MADSTIAWLTSWTPTTDDLLVFYDNADWVTKKAAISTLPAGASNLTIGTSTITGGTSWRVLYNNAWVAWELPTSGASSVVLRDTNQNIVTNNTNEGYQTVVSAAGTTTLTVSSPYATFITGSTTQTVVLPNATTLILGFQFRIHSNTSGVVTIQTNGGATLWIMAASTDVVVTCTDISTAAGIWDVQYLWIVTVSWKKVSISNSLSFNGTDSTQFTFPSANDIIVGRTSTDTLTNKRITKRVTTEASNATPSINSDNFDIYRATALAANITSITVTWTPTDGQMLLLSFLDNGTPRTLTPGASFENSTVSFPSTTVASTRLDVLCIWNTATSKWRVLATA